MADAAHQDSLRGLVRQHPTAQPPLKRKECHRNPLNALSQLSVSQSISYEVQNLRLVTELVVEGILPLPRDVTLTPCWSAALASPELADGSMLVGRWSVDGGGYGV